MRVWTLPEGLQTKGPRQTPRGSVSSNDGAGGSGLLGDELLGTASMRSQGSSSGCSDDCGRPPPSPCSSGGSFERRRRHSVSDEETEGPGRMTLGPFGFIPFVNLSGHVVLDVPGGAYTLRNAHELGGPFNTGAAVGRLSSLMTVPENFADTVPNCCIPRQVCVWGWGWGVGGMVCCVCGGGGVCVGGGGVGACLRCDVCVLGGGWESE